VRNEELETFKAKLRGILDLEPLPQTFTPCPVCKIEGTFGPCLNEGCVAATHCHHVLVRVPSTPLDP